ncbi:MAG: CHRD domain-containing protein [Caldilineaceae bacterium]|nr:CHRD domain-containing protein [Caldilineaceae bacterium]
MKRSRVVSLLSVLFVLFAVATTTAASSVKNFRTQLSGGEEVPAVVTNAHGKVQFKLTDDGSALQFRLVVANIVDVTAAHIHLAPAGVNGGIVVWLYPLNGPPGVLIPGPSNGVLAEGTITAANLTGDLTGATLDDLIAAIVSGNTYVNVHTSANPGGEIRGQLHTHDKHD